MQGFAQTDFSDPAVALVSAMVIAAGMTAYALRSNNRAREAVDPLNGFFSPDRFEAEIEATERRVSPFKPRGAVLRGQIDHLSQVRTLWGPETRANAVKQVAQVMRAGVRKTDMVVQTEGPEGDGSFVILAHGASEEEASGIAKRLLKTIGRTKVRGMGDGMRLSASFGVAARRLGESEDDWRKRADMALAAARASGEDQIMTASEWEEVMMLPAPDPIADCEAGDDVAAA